MISCPEKCSGKKVIHTTLALSMLLCLPAACLAESVATSEWNITADKITRYEDPGSIIAEGDIILEKRVKLPPKVAAAQAQDSKWADLLGETKPQVAITAGEVVKQVEEGDRYKTTVVIKADWLSYDTEKKLINARGNVRVSNDTDTLAADKASVDLNSETGSFTDAVIIRKEDQLHLEGKNIEKTGLNTYHIEDGWVVTCKVKKGETPPWNFASSDTKITEGGYAVMHHATFNIKGVPVFYTPLMIVPVKNTRQSGLLLPEISSSSTGGFGVNVPFFWNLSDSMDITLFPEFYVDRGVMPGFEYRFVRDENAKGTLMASYLDDDLSGSDLTTTYYKDTEFTHTNTDRYWVRGKTDQNIADWQTRLDIDMVSDRDYLTEFNNGYTGFEKSDSRFLDTFGRGFDNKTEDTRQNLLTALKSWEGMSLQFNFLGYNDVRTDSRKASEEDPLWTLPELNFSGIVPISTSGVSFNWDTDYVNFWREDGVGGTRVDLHPSISSAVPLSPYLESRAEVGLRDTFYMVQTYGDEVWNNDDTQNRMLGDFEFEIASPLLRTFAISDKTSDTLDHRLRPYVRYNYIPDVDQDELPDFDSVDYIEEESAITYGVDNFFDGILGQSEREFGYVKISQSYSLIDVDYPDDPDNSDGRFSDGRLSAVNLRLRVTPINRLYMDYETDYDVHGDGFVRHSLESSYTDSRGDFFSIDYSFNNTNDVNEKIDQINVLARGQLLPQWYAQVKVEHSIALDETNEANISLMYTAPCWSVALQTEYTPSDTRFLLVFSLANLGNSLGLGI